MGGGPEKVGAVNGPGPVLTTRGQGQNTARGHWHPTIFFHGFISPILLLQAVPKHIMHFRKGLDHHCPPSISSLFQATQKKKTLAASGKTKKTFAVNISFLCGPLQAQVVPDLNMPLQSSCWNSTLQPQPPMIPEFSKNPSQKIKFYIELFPDTGSSDKKKMLWDPLALIIFITPERITYQ